MPVSSNAAFARGMRAALAAMAAEKKISFTFSWQNVAKRRWAARVLATAASMDSRMNWTESRTWTSSRGAFFVTIGDFLLNSIFFERRVLCICYCNHYHTIIKGPE